MSQQLTGILTSTATIGVDLGGTGTRVVALDKDGRTLGSTVFRTVSSDAAQAVSTLLMALDDIAAGHEVSAVCIGASGPISEAGVIDNSATLPAYTGLDLRSIVTKQRGWPCLVENDAAAAAMGEYTYGAGSGSRAVATVTLGTGIGVAMIADGVLLRAADGSHPEAGHIAVRDAPTRCYCGLARCWEQAASRIALEGLIGGDPQIAAASARDGNASSATAFERYGERVASGLGTLLTLFRPDRVVLGGSAAQYLDLFDDALQAALTRPPAYEWRSAVVPASLGDMAGAVGAAVLARTATAQP